jgi:ferredoxin--NADP+ reductase
METPAPQLRRPLPIGPLGAGGTAVALAPRPQVRREIAPNATVTGRADLTETIARFRVRPDAGVPPFKPGQYFALGLEIDGRLLQRPYSTASPAGTIDELEFLVRRVAAGTFTPRLWEVGPGDRIWIGPPKGLFTLLPGDERTHLFISTGTGLAPFISMTEALLRRDGHPRVVVVHGASYVSELAYRDRLENWDAAGQAQYVPTISRPTDPANAGWTGSSGRTESVLASVCPALDLDPNATVAYLCGNPDMIEAASRTLAEIGFPGAAIVREHYWTAPASR